MRRVLLIAALSLPSFSTAARADQTEDCVNAYERAQELRLDRRLRAAREQLLLCARPTCPKAAVVDCSRWLQEVGEALPTILVSVVDDRGLAIHDVRLTLDGQPPVMGATGAISADPGRHVVRAEASEYLPAESAVVLQEGDKQRVVVLMLEAMTRAPKPPPPASLPDRALPVRATRSSLAYLLGGAGLASLAAASYFWVEGLGARSDVQACAPHCDASLYADRAGTAKTDLVAGDVLGAVGVASLGIAAWIFVTSTASQSPAAPSAAITPKGTGGIARWSF
jgi:hypothetical protein